MGLRFILVTLALLCVMLIVRHFLSRRGGGASAPRAAITDAVRCAHCQLHLPRQEALEQSGRYYCSQEHLRLDREAPGP